MTDLRSPLQPALSFDANIGALVGQFKDLWWNCPATLPDLGPVFSPAEKRSRKSILENSINRLGEQLKLVSVERPSRQVLQDRFYPLMGGVLKASFGLEDSQISALTTYGFTEFSSSSSARRAVSTRTFPLPTSTRPVATFLQ